MITSLFISHLLITYHVISLEVLESGPTMKSFQVQDVHLLISVHRPSGEHIRINDNSSNYNHLFLSFTVYFTSVCVCQNPVCPLKSGFDSSASDKFSGGEQDKSKLVQVHCKAHLSSVVSFWLSKWFVVHVTIISPDKIVRIYIRINCLAMNKLRKPFSYVTSFISSDLFVCNTTLSLYAKFSLGIITLPTL